MADKEYALALIREVQAHTKKVNQWIKDTHCIPNDTSAWQEDEDKLTEALEILSKEK